MYRCRDEPDWHHHKILLFDKPLRRLPSRDVNEHHRRRTKTWPVSKIEPPLEGDMSWLPGYRTGHVTFSVVAWAVIFGPGLFYYCMIIIL